LPLNREELDMVSSVSSSSGYASILSDLATLGKKKKDSSTMADEMVSALDADGDGSLSAAELAGGLGGSSGASASDVLSALDTDGDGEVSSEELAAGLKKRQEQFQAQLDTAAMSTMLMPQASGVSQMADTMMAQADADGDGKISQSELASVLTSATGSADSSADADEVLSALDTDGDGTISEEELIAGLEAQQEESRLDESAMGAMAPPPPPGAGQAGGGSGSQAASSLLSELDTDGDGQISAAEWAAAQSDSSSSGASGASGASSTSSAASDLFSTLDADGDGTVSGEELAAGLSSARGQAGGRSGSGLAASAIRQYQAVEGYAMEGYGISGLSGLSISA
jgi:Ca2+-binding EF-hand superfamily protein